jgi:hypothetical protein
MTYKYIMIMFLIKVLGVFLAFHFYKNRYPNEFDNYSNQIYEYLKNNEHIKSFFPYLLKTGYVFIYIYSFCQIALNKIIKISCPYVQLIRDNVCKFLVKQNIISDKLLKNISNVDNVNVNVNNINAIKNSGDSIVIEDIKTIVSFFNEGKLINNQELLTSFIDLAELELFKNKNENVADHDLVTIKIISKNEDILNTNILTFVNNQIPIHPYSFEISNIKFIACYVKYYDNGYTLELCKDNTNYYIVGNVINCDFIKYYLKNILNVTIDSNIPFKYTLEIMDHNVNMIYLSETDEIIIQKEDYVVNNSEKVVNKEIVNELDINNLDINELNNSKTKVE